MRFVYGVLIALLLAGCGYKPSSAMAREFLGERIYVEVVVDAIEPENAPFIKDELNRIVLQRFGASLVEKKEATTHLKVFYSGAHIYPLTYDKGYITRYRISLPVRFVLKQKNKTIRKTIRTVDEADVQASTLYSTAFRIEAIRRGMRKALDEFIAYTAMQGVMKR